MKYAVLDTESSGLFDFSKPADAPGQPRMASFAFITLEALPDGTVVLGVEREYLIQPAGWEMTLVATAVNGLTTEHLLKHGEPVSVALRHYTTLVEAGYIVAAYNAQFDTKVMRGELRRALMPDLFEKTPNVCLMRACTNIVKVPRKTGTGYKFPKLSEACAFFKIVQEGAHSAMGDTKAAMEVLKALHKANLLPAPEVHYAKEKPTK